MNYDLSIKDNCLFKRLQLPFLFQSKSSQESVLCLVFYFSLTPIHSSSTPCNHSYKFISVMDVTYVALFYVFMLHKSDAKKKNLTI